MLMTYVAGDLAGRLAAERFATLAAFQGESITPGEAQWLVIFVGIIALVMLLQGLATLGIALGAMRAQKALMAEVQELKGKALPLIDKSHALVTDLTPKITKLVDELTPKINDITTKVNSITGHVEHIAELARQKADEFGPTVTKTNETIIKANETVQDANLKTRAQIKRVDGLVSSALDGAVRLGVAIEKGISVPGRELAGIVQGVKVGFDTFLSGAKAFGSGTVGTTKRAYPRPESVPANRENVPSYPRTRENDLDL